MATSRSGKSSLQLRGGVDQHVETLARDEPPDTDDERVRRREIRTAVARRLALLTSVSGRKRVDVDTGRHHARPAARRGPRAARVGFGRRVPAGGDHAGRAADHAREQPAGHRQPPGHGDLGAVEDDGVAARARRGPTSPTGNAGSSTIADAPTSSASASMRVAAAARCGSRTPAGPLDPERLGGVEVAGVRRGRREHGDPLGRQPPPQLPQVRLDAADLGREVVGDEEVRHRAQAAAPRSAAAELGPRPTSACDCTNASSEPSADRRAPRSTATVARRHRRCRGPPARCAGGSGPARSRDVPAAEPAEQTVVVELEHGDDVDPRLIGRGRGGRRGDGDRRPCSAGTPPGSRRTHRCGRPAPRGTRAGSRPAPQQPGQAAAGVEHAGCDERAGGTRGQAARARAAPVGDRRRVVGGSGASVTTLPSTTHEPRPGTSTLAFLPYQPEPGPVARPRGRPSALSSTSTRAREAGVGQRLGDRGPARLAAARSGQSTSRRRRARRAPGGRRLRLARR